MNILILNGHGAGDSGALGNGYKEADLTRELADLVEPKLKNHANVYRYPRERNAYKDVKNGVFAKYLPIPYDKIDYAIEIHFNAYDGKAKGTEIYITKLEKGYSVEQAIVNNIASIGYANRGVKRSNFLVIKTLKNKGVSSALLETCFIDNANDMKTYQEHKNEIAQAIVNGIVDEFGLSGTSKPVEPTQPKPEPPKPSIDYHVVVTANSGLNCRREPNGAKVTAYPKGTKLHVTQENNGWLYVNGTGWVSAQYTSKVNNEQPNQPSKPTYKVGNVYTLQTEMKVRTGAGTNYRAKKHSELTTDGRKHDQDGDGALSQGTRVTCKDVVDNGNEIWLKTPSGYICAYQNGKTYIK